MTADDLRRELEDAGAAVLWLSREDVDAPGPVGMLTAGPDGIPAAALVLCGDNGLATLLELDPETAGGLMDALHGWLEAL